MTLYSWWMDCMNKSVKSVQLVDHSLCMHTHWFFGDGDTYSGKSNGIVFHLLEQFSKYAGDVTQYIMEVNQIVNLNNNKKKCKIHHHSKNATRNNFKCNNDGYMDTWMFLGLNLTLTQRLWKQWKHNTIQWSPPIKQNSPISKKIIFHRKKKK